MQSTLIAVGCNRLHTRDGSQVPFDADKIRQALIAAGKATGEYSEVEVEGLLDAVLARLCLLYTSPSPRDRTRSRMPSSA